MRLGMVSARPRNLDATLNSCVVALMFFAMFCIFKRTKNLSDVNYVNVINLR